VLQFSSPEFFLLIVIFAVRKGTEYPLGHKRASSCTLISSEVLVRLYSPIAGRATIRWPWRPARADKSIRPSFRGIPWDWLRCQSGSQTPVPIPELHVYRPVRQKSYFMVSTMLIDLTSQELNQLRSLIVAEPLAASGLDFFTEPMSDQMRERLLEKLRAADGPAPGFLQ